SGALLQIDGRAALARRRDQPLQIGDADGVEPHEDRREPVVMRLGEERRRLRGQQARLVLEIGDAFPAKAIIVAGDRPGPNTRAPMTPCSTRPVVKPYAVASSDQKRPDASRRRAPATAARTRRRTAGCR